MSDPELSLFDFFSDNVVETLPEEVAAAENSAACEVADDIDSGATVEMVEVVLEAEDDLSSPEPEPLDADKELIPQRELKRAVLGWMALQCPNGMGMGVPTRFFKYKADVAAFWSSPQRRVLHPTETMIVETRRSRQECWPDFSRTEEALLEKLKAFKARKEELQEEIRQAEPHLQDRDALFEEFQLWDYSRSANTEYKKCCKAISEVEESLYGGTRFQHIAAAQVADFLYLAVPAGAVEPQEIVQGWGLLYIHDDMSIEIVKEAEKVGCSEENRFHLVQNIAKATRESLLFANGIRTTKDEEVVYSPIPRRRRPMNK